MAACNEKPDLRASSGLLDASSSGGTLYNSKYRVLVTPAKRGKGKKVKTPDEEQDQTAAEKRASMTWAKRLKRVFNIDIETCSECGGEVRIIASIEDPEVIRKILAHLDEKITLTGTGILPETRAPPSTGLFL